MLLIESMSGGSRRFTWRGRPAESFPARPSRMELPNVLKPVDAPGCLGGSELGDTYSVGSGPLIGSGSTISAAGWVRRGAGGGRFGFGIAPGLYWSNKMGPAHSISSANGI